MEVFRIKIGRGASRRALVVTGIYRQYWRNWEQFQRYVLERRHDYFSVGEFAVYDATGEVTDGLSDFDMATCYYALHCRVIARKRWIEKDTRRMFQTINRLKNEARRQLQLPVRGSARISTRMAALRSTANPQKHL